MTQFCAFCYIDINSLHCVCSDCQHRLYCSVECRNNDWIYGHKHWCTQAGEINVDYEIRTSEGKGLGMYALKTFQKGDTILAERAIVQSERIPQTVHTAIMKLMPQDSENISDKFPLNSIGIGEPFTKHHLFVIMSRVNHHCTGNSDHYYIQQHGVKMLFATRTIEVGEEITFSYINFMSHPHLYSYLERKWRFTCTCSSCANTEMFGKLLQLKPLDQQITDLGRNREFDQALVVGHRLLGLYDELQVSPLLFLRTYYDMFQLCIVRRCTLTQAYKYAQMAYETAMQTFVHNDLNEVTKYRQLMKNPTQHPAFLWAETKEK